MSHRRLTQLAASLCLAVVSCTSKDAPGDRSRGPSGMVVDSSPAAAPAVPWFAGTAPFLLVPAHSNDRAVIVPTDSTAPDMEEGVLAQPGTLLRLDGTPLTVRVSVSSGGEGCVDAALDPAPSLSWGVGFVGQAPSAIVVDSLRSIARADSAALAPIVFRLASTVPNAPGGRFAGLPFALMDLWRIRLPSGAIAIVATTKRQINQEDSPLEERTLIVAEGDSTGAGYNLVHSSRSTGPEETVEGTELLAAVIFPGRSDVQLILAHDFGEQLSYSMLERSATGRWARRWSSRRLSC